MPGILTVVIFTFSLVVNEFVYAITFITSSENRTLTVGVPTDLIRGDLYNWPGIMAAILHPRIPLALALQRVPQPLHRRVHRAVHSAEPTERKDGDDRDQERPRRAQPARVPEEGRVRARAAIGIAGAAAPFSFAGPLKYKGRWLAGQPDSAHVGALRARYDQWLDTVGRRQWGEKNDVEVTIEHINNGLLDTRAAAEVAAQQGHDLFFNLHPMASYEDQVINHASIVQRGREEGRQVRADRAGVDLQPEDEEVLRGLGQLRAGPGRLAARPLERGRPLAGDVGPVKAAAPKLKAIGHPIGIGQSQEIDSNMCLIAFLMCFGSFIQNEEQQADDQLEEARSRP